MKTLRGRHDMRPDEEGDTCRRTDEAVHVLAQRTRGTSCVCIFCRRLAVALVAWYEGFSLTLIFSWPFTSLGCFR